MSAIRGQIDELQGIVKKILAPRFKLRFSAQGDALAVLVATQDGHPLAVVEAAIGGDDRFEVHVESGYSFRLTEYDPQFYKETMTDLCWIVIRVADGEVSEVTERHMLKTISVLELTVPSGQQYGGYIDSKDFNSLVASLDYE